MTIPEIGQGEPLGEPAVSVHQAIRDRGVHQMPGSIELHTRQVGSSPENACDPLRVDLIGPTRSEQVEERKPEQQVPEWCREEDASVEHGDGAGHASVPQLKVLCLLRHLVEGRAALDKRALAIVEDVLELDPAVGSDLAVG